MNSGESQHTTAERITLALSALILVGILSLAVWASVRTGDSPPTIEVEVGMEDIRAEASGYFVPISITNTGGRTAEGVTVGGTLIIDNQEPETAEVAIDFLAGGETEQAELVFTSDPADGEFTVGPTSFLYP